MSSTTVLLSQNRAKVAETGSKPLPKAEILANRANKASDPGSKPQPPAPSQSPTKLAILGSSKESRPLNVEKVTTGGSKPVNAERLRLFDRFGRWALSLHGKVCKVGKEDPRKIVHSIKVGIALTLISLMYLVGPLFHVIGENAIWTVLTVVLVLEFTAGATLYKGVNRGIGTFCALVLAFIIEIIAQKLGSLGCALCIGVSVFVIGASTTYARFFPHIKRNYEQGLIVFLVTFNMIIANGYHEHDVLHMVVQRIYTIAIGCVLCFIMGILVLPNWSSKDLQKAIVSKIEMLAKAIEASVNEYFQDPDVKIIGADASNKSINGYEAVLEWKSADEFRETFASWEPRHSRHCYPWQQYSHLRTVLRHLGYTAISLHGCLESQVQAPQSVRGLFKEPCKRVAKEVTAVLNELASAIRNHCHCSSHISGHLHEALQDLNSAIKSQPRLFLSSKPFPIPGADNFDLLGWRIKKDEDQHKDPEQKNSHQTLSKTPITSLEFAEALPFAAFASLLVEMAARLELLIEEVEELGRTANFKEYHEEPDVKITITRTEIESDEMLVNRR